MLRLPRTAGRTPVRVRQASLFPHTDRWARQSRPMPTLRLVYHRSGDWVKRCRRRVARALPGRAFAPMSPPMSKHLGRRLRSSRQGRPAADGSPHFLAGSSLLGGAVRLHPAVDSIVRNSRTRGPKSKRAKSNSPLLAETLGPQVFRPQPGRSRGGAGEDPRHPRAAERGTINVVEKGTPSRPRVPPAGFTAAELAPNKRGAAA